jgi:hypothetical protein
VRFLNEKRLRDYPRIIFVLMWVIFTLNLLWHQGWIARNGTVFGLDFIAIYSGGILFWEDPQHLYDWNAQAEVQQQLFEPTDLGGGVMIYNSPPYVAMLYGLLKFILPVGAAYVVWSVVNFACACWAAFLMHRHLLDSQLKGSLNALQLSILLLSFLPFVLGVQNGQNQGISLLLVTGILILTLQEKYFGAGVLAGLLLYKPHLAVGFLIVWLVWLKLPALIGFASSAVLWLGATVWARGLEPFLDYFNKVPALLDLNIGTDFLMRFEATLLGLIRSTIKFNAEVFTVFIFPITLLLFGGGLAYYAWRIRKHTANEKIPALMMAVLLPFLISPHIYHYDLVILTPVLALWTQLTLSRRLLYAVIAIYLGAFFLPVLIRLTGIAFSALIPLGMTAALLAWIIQQERSERRAVPSP